MKTQKIAVIVSFLLGGAVGALVYAQWPTSADASGEVSRSLDAVSFSGTTRGEITQSSAVNLNDGSRYAAFSLKPTQSGLLRIEQSGPLNGYLTVLNSEYEPVQSAAYHDLYLWFDEQPDEALTLVVSGYDGNSYGPFRLRTEWLSVQNSGELIEDESLDGFLNNGPNQYSIRIEEQGMYQFDMRSSSFDSYLRLRGPGGEYTDDDSGDGLDARLIVLLEPGEYELTATTPYGDGQDTRGQYNLEMQYLNGMDEYQQGGDIQIGQRIQGFLTGSYIDYQFTLNDSQAVRIDLTSDTFDTYLELEGPGLSLFNDDGGTGTNSMLNETLPGGYYELRVRAYSSGQGPFELYIR